MEPFALTKEEFITRSMEGEVFVSNTSKFFYDTNFINPFRINEREIYSSWDLFDGETKQFTIEQPKPRIERRWKYRENRFGITQETNSYYSDEKAKTSLTSSFYKAEDCYIDVEIKD